MSSREVRVSDIQIERIPCTGCGRSNCSMVKQQGMVDLVVIEMSQHLGGSCKTSKKGWMLGWNLCGFGRNMSFHGGWVFNLGR